MALIATGQTLVILTRNIDLSVGSVVGFTAFATGGLIAAAPGAASAPAGAGWRMAVGAVFGAVNGVLVAYGAGAVDHRDAGDDGAVSARRWSSSRDAQTDHHRTACRNGWSISRITVCSRSARWSFAQAFCRGGGRGGRWWHLALTRLRAGAAVLAVGSNPEAAETGGH